MLNKNNVVEDSVGNKINIQRQFSELYILCVVLDHYPALSFQARHFLKWHHTDKIKPPIVMDIFNLDIMIEMLPSPLFFLSYLSRRTNYIDKIISPNEVATLALFMQHNLLLQENDCIALDYNACTSVDSAMIVRRLGIAGKAIPDGIISQLLSGHLGKILKSISNKEDPALVDFGFLVLSFSHNDLRKLEDYIEKLLKASKNTKNMCGFNVPLQQKECGITICSNKSYTVDEVKKFIRYCDMQKYISKAANWWGLLIDAKEGSLKLAIKCKHPWTQCKEMDLFIKSSRL